LTGYYNKTDLDTKFTNIANGTTALTGYYTKTTIDGKITDITNSTALTNFYNKTDIDTKISGIDTTSYYAKKTNVTIANDLITTTSLNTGTFTLGNILKYGGTSTGINIATNLTFPLHNYYYVYQNSIDGFLDIRLPDVHNQTIPPFQFTIVNMYPADTYGLVPYSSSASTPTFLYSKTGLQLASRNQVYNVSSSTSIFLTIHYFDKKWYLM